MTNGTFMDAPFQTATHEQMRLAIMCGTLVHREQGVAFYQIGAHVYVVPDTELPSVGETGDAK